MEERAWQEAMSAADLAEARGDYAAEFRAIQSSLKPAQSFGSGDLRLASTYERMGAAYCDNGKLRDVESATKGGKPDLAAPAPRKPDDKPNLSKMWQADPRNTKLSLTVYVQASIGDSGLFPILSRAQSVASGMFATAGARINWRTGLAKASEPELPILIDITWNTPEEFHPGALAYAHPFEGVHIRVFYDRVKSAHRPQATAMLLAHVLVHEITHVLEGMDRHSEEGVMKAQWTADDLVQMVYKPLPFDPQDVLLIRKSLANRGRPARKAPLGLISPTALSN